MEISNNYDQNIYEYNDDFNIKSSPCSKFSRRHDFSTFNMTDYLSCENCRHLTADNVCVTKTT